MSLAPYEKRIIELAFFYGQDATKEQVSVWASFLAKRLSIEELGRAIEMYCNNSGNKFFPRPVTELVDLIHNPLKSREEADLIATRINQAIIEYGYMNGAAALAFIGPIGAKVVRAYGGWRVLCEMHGVEINAATVRAQMRDHALAELNLQKAGVDEYDPGRRLERKREAERLGGQNDERRKQTNLLIAQLANQKGVE